jgi:parvulin-like peptidyl-prolyl isomerase
MRRFFPHLVLFLACVLVVLSAARAGVVIDRIVATVNGRVVLLSDWEDTICFEAFADARPLAQVSDQDRAAALNRLIDQELLREQIAPADIEKVSAEQVQQKIAALRSLYPAATSEDGWRSLLASYGLDEAKLQVRVKQELGMLQQIDARLRPSVQVDSASVEAYYRDTFLPELHKAGAADVPLSEVSGRIREILTQQKVNELFTSWMQTLRRESRIRTRVPVAGLKEGSRAEEQ